MQGNAPPLVDIQTLLERVQQVKIGCTTFLKLLPVNVFSPYGEHEQYVYIDASVKYFGSEHLLYALPALVFSTTLVVIPLILLCARMMKVAKASIKEA